MPARKMVSEVKAWPIQTHWLLKGYIFSPSKLLSLWEPLACCINSLPKRGQQAFSLKGQAVITSGFVGPVGPRVQLLNFTLVVRKQPWTLCNECGSVLRKLWARQLEFHIIFTSHETPFFWFFSSPYHFKNVKYPRLVGWKMGVRPDVAHTL